MFARRPGLPIVALALIKFKFMLRQCVSAHTVTFRLTAHAYLRMCSLPLQSWRVLPGAEILLYPHTITQASLLKWIEKDSIENNLQSVQRCICCIFLDISKYNCISTCRRLETDYVSGLEKLATQLEEEAAIIKGFLAKNYGHFDSRWCWAIWLYLFPQCKQTNGRNAEQYVGHPVNSLALITRLSHNLPRWMQIPQFKNQRIYVLVWTLNLCLGPKYPRWSPATALLCPVKFSQISPPLFPR